MPPVPINYWAVLVATAAMFGLGGLWYGPLFGKSWSALMGWTPDQINAMKADPEIRKKMMRSYAIMVVSTLVMVWILAHAVIFASAYLAFYGLWAGVAVGFLNWLGFVAPATLTSVLWESKSWKLWFLNASFYLVGLMIAGAILAVWM